MPYHVTIIHAQEFIRATTEGTLDYEETRRQLIQLAPIVDAQADSGILIDTRRAHSTLLIINLWDLVSEFRKQFAAMGRKIAVLCPPDRFDQAKFLELCSQNRGLNVLAFTSFEEALDWLFATAGSPEAGVGIPETGTV